MLTPIQPESWVPSDGIILEPNAETVVRSNFNTVVVAGPGAGKTELLAQRACFLLQTNACKAPKRILAISFKKDAATNLADRVEKRCGKVLAQRFDSYTFDAFAKSLLDKFINALPTAFKPSKNYEIIYPNRDLMQESIHELTLPSAWSAHNIYEIRAQRVLDNLCSRPLPLNDNNTLEQWAIKEIWKKWLSNPTSSRLSFPMISRLSTYLLTQNPLLVRALHMTYSHIFLDEFQDTTYIQYDLLKSAFHKSQAVFTAVGDTKQRIMGWAGALSDVFLTYCNDFCAQRLDLITNHRSAPVLVNIQAALFERLDPNAVPAVAADGWEANDGVCEIHLFESHIQEAEILARQINEWIDIDHIDPRKIVILTKQHVDVYASEIIAQLRAVGQKARIESDMQDLLTEPLSQIILQFFRLATMDRMPKDWQATVELLMELRGCHDENKIGKSIEVENQLAAFIHTLRIELSNVTQENCLPAMVRYILSLVVSFIGEISFKNHFPQYKRGIWFEELLNDTSSALAIEYQAFGNWAQALNSFEGKDTIPIMTIHKSKGLEYEIVIFLGLEDDAFWSFSNQPHEDTCAFFVALSRARQVACFTFCDIRRTRRGNRYQRRDAIGSLYTLLRRAGVAVIDNRQDS
ncbi:superfamily I DNA/RNA helicase [Anaerospora hongkongensis]|uniref:DNA 3'-5' helicase n=1 Tax=Anaerospora hongkongensis TaxID=244830 RepID=A0A4R1PW41_9FIRM|nr:ATP-dependent helicase [Anaerospora hongkongensis]TCL35109.1 superfamily I DNA/RNA helicase [Anaerospora hongkongensis]